MKKTLSKSKEIKLVGLKTRTNNKTEFNSMEGKIFPCVQQYFGEQLANKIANRTQPGTTLCVYTEYESDHNGDYTYYIGEIVDSFDGVPENLHTLIIPPQKYAKFTTNPGPMPNVLRDAWQAIWNMNSDDFGGERTYIADYEVYDERAHDHSNLTLDIYIGIK